MVISNNFFTLKNSEVAQSEHSILVKEMIAILFFFLTKIIINTVNINAYKLHWKIYDLVDSWIITTLLFAGSAPVQQAVHIQGQEPLTSTMLAAAPPPEQKQMLGERLFPLIHPMYPLLAGKITGMLLEIDNSELLHMLVHNESLKAKVEEAMAVLQAHQAKQSSVKKE